VLFIGTQFSILYTSMYSPAGADIKGRREGRRHFSASQFSRTQYRRAPEKPKQARADDTDFMVSQARAETDSRESVLFIGTKFSNLYTVWCPTSKPVPLNPIRGRPLR